MTRLRRTSLWFVPAIFFILNLIPWSSSLAFEQQHFPEAFSRSWGWPISAYAAASDRGIELIDASVVLHGSRVVRGIFRGQYPHLAVNLAFAIIDLMVVVVTVFAVFATASHAGGDSQSGGRYCGSVG